MNILYIGPNDSEWAQANLPGSLAGAKWSRGLQTALAKLCNLTTLSHTYMYPWPKGGKLWVGYDKRYYPEGWKCVPVCYPALRYVREWWWRFSYATKAMRIVHDCSIDVVIMYNCYEHWQLPVLRAIRKAKPSVLIIPIILDGDDPRKDDWGWLRRAAKYTDGFVSLSWWVYENLPRHIPDKKVYHLDGGAEGWRGSRPTKHSKPVTLVHTGALDQWRGLDFMIGVVKTLTEKRKDTHFVFCGKSSEVALRRVFGDNPQVSLPGFVSEEEMARICNGADVLLSVRDPNHPDNILNYPSKLPQYLSFGRPIVSTRLESLSPDYAQVVNTPDDDSVEAYVRKIEEVISWPFDRCVAEYEKIKAWFNLHKRWDILASDLVKWLEPLTTNR